MRRSTDPIGRRKKSPKPHPIDEPMAFVAASRTAGNTRGANARSSRPRIRTEAE
jgi:hypothetical protein